MAETNEPAPPEDSQEASPSLVERVAARMRAPGPEDGGSAADAAQLATLATGLAKLRVQMQDLEKSLVERIADVDDDRRLTAVQLQRAWQNQREEQEAIRRGRGKLLAGVLALIALFAAGGLYSLYRNVQSGQEALHTRIDDLRLEVDRMAVAGGRDTQVQEKIDVLAAAVGRISQDLTKSVARPAQAAGQGETSAQISTLAARIDRIGAEQSRIDRSLADLQTALAEQSMTETTVELAKSPAALGPDSSEPQDSPRPASPAATATQGGKSESAPVRLVPPDSTAPSPIQTVPVGERPFALQIMGSYSKEDLLTHAARLSLPSEVFLREESRRGRPWYVLIHGLYASRAQAQEALAALPPSLRAPKPWIRSLPPDAAVEPISRLTVP